LPANWWRVACRNEEHAADRHAVEILRRTRYSKDDLVDALTGSAGFRLGRGGFLSTHPAIDERIATIQRLR
jgi:Zn-dependent protease with chaperone function